MNKTLKSFLMVLVSLLFITLPVYGLSIGDEISHKDITQGASSGFTTKRAGTYFISLGLNEPDSETDDIKTKIHIKFPKTVLNYSQQEGIDAHDILVLTGTFNKQNKIQIIDQANAHAWSMEDGKEINNVNVNVKDPVKHSGTINQVEFSTPKDTRVEVNVFEQDEINIKLEELYMNQYPVLTTTIRTLSYFILSLAIFPTLLFFGIFGFIKKEAEEIEDLLSQ